MFNFDVFVSSELKAICAELGIAVGNSAPKSEYVSALDSFFGSDNVNQTLMGLKRENLKKVARKLSLSGSGTKREMTDAIVAKVNPQPGPIVIDSEPEVTEPEAPPADHDHDPDPDPEETRKSGLPWWAWLLVLAAVIGLVWVIFYRPVSAPVNLTPLQTSLNQISTKVENIGKTLTDLTGRVTLLEAPAPEVPTKEPDVSSTPAPIDKDVPLASDIVVADQVFSFNGSVPAYSDFRAAVNQPGEAAVFVWNFTVPLENAVVVRVWPDDTLVSAKLLVPGQDPKDLTSLFGMFFVPKGGTGDATLDTVLQERGVNVVEGEILMQNKFSVNLGNVPAGSKIVFEIKDNEELAVNRGIGVVIDTLVDAFTVDVK